MVKLLAQTLAIIISSPRKRQLDKDVQRGIGNMSWQQQSSWWSRGDQTQTLIEITGRATTLSERWSAS